MSICTSLLLSLNSSLPPLRCISHPLLHFPVWRRSASLLPGGRPGSVHLRGWHHLLGEALPHLYWYVAPHPTLCAELTLLGNMITFQGKLKCHPQHKWLYRAAKRIGVEIGIVGGWSIHPHQQNKTQVGLVSWGGLRF